MKKPYYIILVGLFISMLTMLPVTSYAQEENSQRKPMGTNVNGSPLKIVVVARNKLRHFLPRCRSILSTLSWDAQARILSP